MIPTLKELPLGPENSSLPTKAGAPPATTGPAGMASAAMREAFGTLIDGLPVDGTASADDMSGIPAKPTARPESAAPRAGRTPDWAAAQLEAVPLSAEEPLTPAATAARSAVSVEGDPTLPVASVVAEPDAIVVERPARELEIPTIRNNQAAPGDPIASVAAPVAPPAEKNSREPNAEPAPRRSSREDAPNAIPDRTEPISAPVTRVAASRLPEADEAGTALPPVAEANATSPDRNTVSAEATESNEGVQPFQSNQPVQPSQSVQPSPGEEVRSTASAPNAVLFSNGAVAADPSAPTATREYQQPPVAPQPVAGLAIAASPASGSNDGPEAAVPNIATAATDKPVRVGAETALGTAPTAPKDAASSMVGRSDGGTAQVATDRSARRDLSVEREPRAGTATLAASADRAVTTAPIQSGVTPAVSAGPTATASANVPPTFAAAEVAARMVEGEAEKAAQTALAADAEISITPTRTERDADFRAVLRQAPATPVPAANLAREVMQAAISAKGSGSIELRIDPVELGKLDIEFSVIDDRMNIIVRAERDEALELMRRNSDDLEKMLREAGVDLGSLSFSQGGSDDPQQKNRFGLAGLGGDSAVPDAPASHLSPVGSTDRLDIRV